MSDADDLKAELIALGLTPEEIAAFVAAEVYDELFETFVPGRTPSPPDDIQLKVQALRAARDGTQS